MKTNTWNAEMTDTFAGEANYSWVKRESLKLRKGITNRGIVKAAKAAFGYTGFPCTVDNYGDSFTIKPRGMCVVIFITFADPQPE